MNKLVMHIFLILVYVGFSKSFSPTETDSIFIKNDKVFTSIFPKKPIAVILVKQFESGIFIKTYSQVYKIYDGGHQVKNKIVRVSKEFYLANQQNLGMAIYQHSDFFPPIVLPLPPGSMFIDDSTYGEWVKHEHQHRWVFKRNFQNLIKDFGLENFSLSKQFFLTMREHIKIKVPFYGLYNEFGTNGTHTANWQEVKIPTTTDGRTTVWNYVKNRLAPPWKKPGVNLE